MPHPPVTPLAGPVSPSNPRMDQNAGLGRDLSLTVENADRLAHLLSGQDIRSTSSCG